MLDDVGFIDLCGGAGGAAEGYEQAGLVSIMLDIR
jgi:site-specific DNA-cytosine methylase